MWSLDKVGCMAKSSQQSFCHLWQNIHYHLTTNLQNHITTNIFYVVGIITSKQQIFSVRSSPDPPILKTIAVRSSPDPAKIGFSPDPVRSSPDPCSSLEYFAKDYLWTVFPGVLLWNPEAYSKEVGECQKFSFLRSQIKPWLFFKVPFKALC